MIPRIPKNDEVIQKAVSLVNAGQNAQQIIKSLTAAYRHVPIKKRNEIIARAVSQIKNHIGAKLEEKK